MTDKFKKTIKNVLITLAFPVGMFIFSEVICLLFKQTHILNSVLDVKNLIRNTGISCIVAYALSFNLPSGRLDFSLGAQRVVGTIIGGNFALYLGLSGVWVLLFSIVFGIIFGFITGYVFVLTRINPMVLGIGMGLIFECIAFVSTKGVGLDLFGVPGVSILTNELFTMGTIAVTALIVLLVTGYTRFGYNLRAIQGSQAIAQGAGINVFKNAVVCYTFAGGLVCVAGTLDAALNNQMESTMGFSSQGPVMTHFFSMQLGGYLAKWSNMPIGIIVASLTLRIFTTLLIRFELDDAMLSSINMMLFLVFLVFRANDSFFDKRKAEKLRIRQANEKKKAFGLV